MKFHSLFLTVLMALSLSMGSCSNDDAIKVPDGETGGVKLTFNIGVASRAGDDDLSRADGEYFDMGLPGERTVSNAVIIIYDRPINAADAADGKIVKSFYVTGLESFTPSTYPNSAEYFDPNSAFYPQSDVLNTISVGKVRFSNYYKKKIEVKPEDGSKFEVGKRYYATAICNFGDITNEFQPGASMSTLRDYIYKGKLYEEKKPDYSENGFNISNSKGSEGIRAYSEFRMSGINETSFNWKQNDKEEELKLGDFMVQRLAARLDVMFGEAGTDFINQESYFNDKDIILAVYTDEVDGKGESTGNLVINSSYNFYLTDLEIVNNVETSEQNNQKTYMYLIERSSKVAPTGSEEKDASSVVYFDNEGWTNDKHLAATKYVYSPTNKSHKKAYSLPTISGYQSLPDLIKAGVFYNDNANNYNDNHGDYYENKKASSIVGYLAENTNSSKHTILRVKGWTNASTSGIFQGTSRAVPATGYHEVVGEIPIYHSLNSTCMRYGVVRNTIYRIRIKIVARDNKVYFEYYYVTPNSSNQKPLTASGFLAEVGENTGDITPND